jgi:predicted metalloprotease with PDZ domain
MSARVADPIRYRVSFTDPRTHLFHVELEMSGLDGRPFQVWMPSWTPGSYLVREYARNVQGLAATDGDGTPLHVQRTHEDAWRVDPAGGDRVRLAYRVYAFELTVRTSHLDDTHGYWNGASLFLTSDAWLEVPVALSIEPPPGWSLTTTLSRAPDGSFRAAHFDELCDTPVHAAPETPSIRFEVAGVPHELAFWGRGNHDPAALAADLAKITGQAAQLFGGLPYDRYLFLTLLTDKGRGGLEHRNCCTLLYPRFGFRPEKARQEFWFLAAHELFHAWNVKRLRPRALVPYRYREENLTGLLWFFEGFTSYYELLLTLRAGLISAARFLELLGQRMTQLARTPGRRVQSAEETSFCAWIKHYRPDENSINSTVSYYLKGALIALALDLELRRRGSSLDALMVRLWRQYGEDESGLPEDAIQAEAERLAGTPLPGIFAQAVAGTADPDYAALEDVGLRARSRARESAGDKGGTRPRQERQDLSSWFGVQLRAERAVIQSVLSGSPAERAGLSAEDELVAADGLRLAPESWQLRIEGQPPGSQIRVSYFRRDELRETTVVLAEAPTDTWWIERIDPPSEAQRAAFRAWTSQTL